MGVDWGREWIPGWAPTHCDIGGGGQGGAKNRPPISQDFRVMIEIPTDFDTRNARAHTHMRHMRMICPLQAFDHVQCAVLHKKSTFVFLVLFDSLAEHGAMCCSYYGI